MDEPEEAHRGHGQRHLGSGAVANSVRGAHEETCQLPIHRSIRHLDLPEDGVFEVALAGAGGDTTAESPGVTPRSHPADDVGRTEDAAKLDEAFTETSGAGDASRCTPDDGAALLATYVASLSPDLTRCRLRLGEVVEGDEGEAFTKGGIICRGGADLAPEGDSFEPRVSLAGMCSPRLVGKRVCSSTDAEDCPDKCVSVSW